MDLDELSSMEWLLSILQSTNLTWSDILWGVGLFVITFSVSLAVVTFILVRLPATYFLDSHCRGLWIDQHPVIRWLGILTKNLLGVVLVVVGVATSLPGVPGQGILTILIGIMLLDFPGKRRLERKLVARPRILRTINNLRARFGRPPLIVEDCSQREETKEKT